MAPVVPVVAVAGLLIAPAQAGAAVPTFHRFEAVATANFTVVEQCDDGSTAQTLVTVIGGHEEEQESGETTLDSDFLTVLIRGTDCAGNFINDIGFGEAEFSFSPSLQEAQVTGVVTTRDGRTVAVDVQWEATGQPEVTTNTTQFPGFVGIFVGVQRDAVASGEVTVDGELLVSGTTTRAQIETLEDTNRTLPA